MTNNSTYTITEKAIKNFFICLSMNENNRETAV